MLAVKWICAFSLLTATTVNQNSMNDKVAFINIGPDLSSKNNSIALIVGNVKPTTGYNQGAMSEAEK